MKLFKPSILVVWLSILAIVAALGVASRSRFNPSNQLLPPHPLLPTLLPSPANLEPVSGTYFGVNLDWELDSPSSYNQRLGHRAAVFVQFFQFPLTSSDTPIFDSLIQAVKAQSGMAMITLEPNGGLDQVTPQAAETLAVKLADANRQGVPVFIRFAHEMNGSWYPWSQQPGAYIHAFQIVAEAVHRSAPQSAMVWAPNYGGGYPFHGGQYEAKPGTTDFKLLDTNGDGNLSMQDDPYAPYYPGDAAVDWVGMSLYHWGNAYPWGENEIPEAGKFIDQLTGNYNGLNGDDRAVPDFYQVYYGFHHKPVAITETAAFYDPHKGGPSELDIKQAWWRQVFDPATLKAYPGIKMINWFEHEKPESEVGGAMIDWRALGSPSTVNPFKDDLPLSRLVFAP